MGEGHQVRLHGSDRNARDVLGYASWQGLKVEFATAVVHNAFYFHKFDNVIQKRQEMSESFRDLIKELFKTRRPKNWYRAYFNHGVINYINGGARLLPCEMNGHLHRPLGRNIRVQRVRKYRKYQGRRFRGYLDQRRAKSVRQMAKVRDELLDDQSVSPESERKWQILRWMLQQGFLPDYELALHPEILHPSLVAAGMPPDGARKARTPRLRCALTNLHN
jgi:hypothetical protein